MKQRRVRNQIRDQVSSSIEPPDPRGHPLRARQPPEHHHGLSVRADLEAAPQAAVQELPLAEVLRTPKARQVHLRALCRNVGSPLSLHPPPPSPFSSSALADGIAPDIGDGLTSPRWWWCTGLLRLGWVAVVLMPAGDRLPNPQSLELAHNVLGALSVVLGHVQCQLFERDAVIPALLAYVREVRHLR
jgi:hypothetical protein